MPAVLTMKRFVVFLAIVCAIVASSSVDHAGAQDPTVFLDPAFASAAPEIVNGVIVATTVVEVDGQPHTIYEIEVTEAVVGERTGSALVQIPGGVRSDGTTIVVSHQPQFEPSDEVQLALGPTEVGVDEAVAKSLATELEVVTVYGGMQGTHWFDGEGISTAEAAGDFVLFGPRWGSFPINYQVNPASSGLATDATIQAVQRAFARWEDDPGSRIDFTYAGTTNAGLPPSVGGELFDGVNVIAWVPATQPYLALASWGINQQGNVISFDIRVNQSAVGGWAVGAVPLKNDIESVVAHEIGHALGLDHTPAPSELMYFQIQTGTVKPLGLGDLSGARRCTRTRCRVLRRWSG